MHDCRLEEGQKPKSEGKENRIGQNAVEREFACHAVRNTGAEKRKEERALSCKYVQNLKGDENSLLQVEAEP